MPVCSYIHMLLFVYAKQDATITGIERHTLVILLYEVVFGHLKEYTALPFPHC